MNETGFRMHRNGLKMLLESVDKPSDDWKQVQGFSMRPELIEALRLASRIEGRSMSAMVASLVENYLTENYR